MIAIEEDKIKCPKCGRENIRKNGMILKNDGTRVQRYQCRDCGYSFTTEKKKIGVTRP
jgi:transposase-like protein